MINQVERERRSSASAAAAADCDFDDEETKMEKFYELIRRFNEARAYHQQNQVDDFDTEDQINHNHKLNCNNQNKVVLKNPNNNAKLDNNNNNNFTTNLIPSFKWEDFRDVIHLHQQQEDEDHHQVDVCDKSGTNFLQPSCNFGINKCSKKRKINELVEANNGEYDDDDGEYDEGYEISITEDQLKVSRTQYKTGLDLNLAL